jgi:hypothetical protein
MASPWQELKQSLLIAATRLPRSTWEIKAWPGWFLAASSFGQKWQAKG